MSGLIFLVLRSAKNRFLELLRKPAKLALYAIMLVGLAVYIIAGAAQRGSAPVLPPSSDIMLLKGLIFAYLLLFYYSAIKMGLSNGSAIFGMDDVNLLFVSPVNPRSILLYGIAHMMKSVALASIFILFQAGTLASFGVGTGGVLILYAGYFLTAAVSQILGMFIYSVTNGRPKRRRIVKIVAFASFAPMLIVAASLFSVAKGDFMTALSRLLASPATSFTPVIGWASAGIIAFVTGEYAAGALFFGLLAALGGGLVAVIYIGRPDYYEDVLVATETAFETKRSAAEGKINALEANSKKRVRVKGTGVGGFGASAFFYKHLRESFRANRFGLWGLPTLVMAATAAIAALAMRESFEDALGAQIVMLFVLGILMWLQIFLIGTGRGIKETYTHYIYMVPESPFKKMVWSNIEIMLKALVEGVVIFTAAGVAAGATAAAVVGAVLAYTLFIFMLIAINYTFMRFAGTDISAGLLISLYMFAIMLVLSPGVVAAAFAGAAGGIPLALAVLSVWELIMALVCLWASRGILHECDMAVMRQPGGK